jgi:hypothetical protein
MKTPKTKIIEGRKYKRSESEFPRNKAFAKARELRYHGYNARVEPTKTGKFVIYICKKKVETAN